MSNQYSKEHIWVNAGGEFFRFGITTYAQEQLGDVVYLELRAPGEEIKCGDSFGVIESVKSVSPLIAPVNGRITRINDDLVDEPDLINQDPEGEAWLLEVEIEDSNELEQLLYKEQYREYLVSLKND